MSKRSFSVDIDGNPGERMIAVFLSPFIVLVCWGCLISGQNLLRGAHFIVQCVYYEVVLAVLMFAVLALLWGLFRPRALHWLLSAAAKRVSLTLLTLALLAVLAPAVAFAVLAVWHSVFKQ